MSIYRIDYQCYINVFRRTKLLRLPGEREVKEVDEEMHENDEEISHHRTGQTVQVSNHSVAVAYLVTRRFT